MHLVAQNERKRKPEVTAKAAVMMNHLSKDNIQGHLIADLEENINLKPITKWKWQIKLDGQIDRSMRETAIINGISGSETTWEETRNKLADTLSTLSQQPPDFYKKKYC